MEELALISEVILILHESRMSVVDIDKGSVSGEYLLQMNDLVLGRSCHDDMICRDRRRLRLYLLFLVIVFDIIMHRGQDVQLIFQCLDPVDHKADRGSS